MGNRKNLGSASSSHGQSRRGGGSVPRHERAHRLVDLEQLDLEPEGRIRRDHRREAPCTVSL